MKKEQKVIRVFGNGFPKTNISELNTHLSSGYVVVSSIVLGPLDHQVIDYLIEKSDGITSEVDRRKIIADCIKEVKEEIKQSVEKFDLDSLSVLPKSPVKKEIKTDGDPGKDGLYVTDKGEFVFYGGVWFAFIKHQDIFYPISLNSQFPEFYYIDHE